MLILYALMRIFDSFVPSMPVKYACAAILVTITILTLPSMKRSAQIVFFVLALAGSALLIVAKADFDTWIKALLKNGDLLLLFICVPMIAGPFYYEDYQSELKHLAEKRMQNMMGFLVLVAILSHFLGVILSVGAIIIIYELLSPFGKLYNADGPFLKTMHRGYCSAGFWSPAWASVIVYSAFPDVKWVRMIPLGILLGALFNLLSLGSLYIEAKRHPGRYPDIRPSTDVKVDKRKLIVMLVLMVTMILSIVIVYTATKWSLMLSVTVVSLLFPIAAALIQGHLPEYGREMKKYYNVQLPKVNSQIAVFMMAGFLGYALSVSGAGNLLVSLLPNWLIAYPPLMIAAIMMLVTVPTFVGVHPAATGTALVASIAPAAVGLTNYTFSLAILTGWLLATMMGPFSAVSLLLSSYTGKNNYALSIGSNWKFCLLCLVVFSLLISVVGPLMG